MQENRIVLWAFAVLWLGMGGCNPSTNPATGGPSDSGGTQVEHVAPGGDGPGPTTPEDAEIAGIGSSISNVTKSIPSGGSDVELDASDNIWLLTPVPPQLRKYDADLKLLATVPLAGVDGATGFGLAANGDFVVADPARNRVGRFAATGAPIANFGSGGFVSATGGSASSLSHPTDAAVSSEGHVYVSDTENRRIVEFGTDGSFVRDAKTSSRPFGLSEYNKVIRVAIDNGKVEVYNLDLRLSRQFSTVGSGIVHVAARDGRLTVTSSNGSVQLTDTTGTSIRDEIQASPTGSSLATAILPESIGILSFVVCAADSLAVVKLTDADDATPQAVWTGFLQALRDGDSAGASSFVGTESREWFFQKFPSDKPDRLRALADHVGPSLTLHQQDTTSAMFDATVDGIVDAARVLFHRTGPNGTWRITRFLTLE